jgi:hypothetical protein
MMALSNQSELPAFFSPREADLKISHCVLPNPITIPEDNLRNWRNPRRRFTKNGQIPDDDLSR